MKFFVRLLIFILILFNASNNVYADNIDEILSVLQKSNFSEKEELITKLGNIQTNKSLKVLKSLEKGILYYIKKSKINVFAKKVDKKYELTDITSGKNIGLIKKNKIKRISLNNKLRKYTRTIIAKSSLLSDNKNMRIEAAKTIFESNSIELLPLISQALKNEKNKNVIKELLKTQASLSLLSGDKLLINKSLDYLMKTTDPEIISVVNQFIEKYKTEDSYKEEIIKANNLLNKINSDIKLYKLIENLFFGLSLGSVLFIAAVGLAITFGVMGVINLAHGEMIMIGAYTTYVIQLIFPQLIEYSLFIALPFAFLVTGLIGVVIERLVIRYLYGRPLETLLATFGISLILQQLVRSIFSPINMPVTTPQWMSGMLNIHPALSLAYGRLYIIAFSISIFIALLILLRKSHFGIEIRAVMQNRPMARAMGIKTNWIDSMTFGLGSGIAGIAGVALSQITNVGPNLGQSYIIDCFMVVVFGGVGNIWGTLSGAFLLGVGNKFLEPYSGAVLAKIITLIFLIVFIQKKPKGMFALKGRAAEINQ
ncbi:MAG TPA: urea ABC transporter permease subunit UrtB [Alphaproteobacteria bacterium]|nr:urea ABC transporter permease subunit UrtB [Alphaproteobacteria bacterium]